MMQIVVLACIAAITAAAPGYAPAAYSAPLSYSNVYNAPLAYNGGFSRFAGASTLAAPLASPLASPLAYSGLGYGAQLANPLAYAGAYPQLAGAYSGFPVAGYPGAIAASPLAYSGYNNPFLRSGFVRPLNYLY